MPLADYFAAFSYEPEKPKPPTSPPDRPSEPRVRGLAGQRSPITGTASSAATGNPSRPVS